MIETYWIWIGGPWSVWVGSFSDRTSVPISELLLWFGLICTLLLCLCPWVPNLWTRTRYGLILGLTCLIIQVFSQGATSWDFVPTVFRTPVSSRAPKVEVQSNAFQNWWQQQQDHLLTWPQAMYETAPEVPDLAMVNDALDQVLINLNYPSGRSVKRWKTMAGFTKVLGLAYGGPAYHDVISGEVVMVSEQDWPSSKAWRWCTLVHEVAHAKGFTREMDAECLTWLALGQLEHPMGLYLQSWLALGKTGQKISLPIFLEEEQKRVWKARKALHQPLVSFFKSLGKRYSIQNTAQKYGAIAPDTTPPPQHEFFGMVLASSALN